MRGLALTAAFVLAIGAIGCGTATSAHDGGGGAGGSGGGGGSDGSSGAMDLATTSTDMSLACTMPGACGHGGVCCERNLGPHAVIFCDTTDHCPINHGVDTSQSPLCNSAADCYQAQLTDMGTLYCCVDPSFPGSGIKTCRNLAC
jgi:hypothetical protein